MQTNVQSLLERSISFLSQARERRTSSSSADLWQLEIIISDGICQDHEELRALLRKAEEENILLVFIVIDAPSSDNGDKMSAKGSILEMNQAAFKNVDGRMELVMQRYLDSFPFDYFVVLRNVEELPDILSDTLRQFFERLAAS